MSATKLYLIAALTVVCISPAFGQSGSNALPPVVSGGIDTAPTINQQSTVVAQVPQTTPSVVQGSGNAGNDSGSDFFSGGYDDSRGAGAILADTSIPPCWKNERGRVYGNFLYMTRQRQSSNFNIVVDGANTPVLTNYNFNFDYEPGFEVGFRQKMRAMFELDVRYMQLDSMNSPIVPFSLIARGALVTNPQSEVNAGDHTARYGSNLYSGEINFLRQYSTNTKIGVGFRMIQLTELLEMDFNFATSTSSIDMLTRNYLYGAQFVSETLLLHTNRLRFDFFSKNGIYGNTASRNMTVVNPNIFRRLEDREATFVGESGIRCSLRISNCWSVNGGYQAVYMSGVALATDQIQNTTSAGTYFPGIGYAPLETDMSDTFYHGAFLGIEFRR